MKTIGNLIRGARLQNNISAHELGEMTHIKTVFINAIETGKWEALPSFSTTLGFVKSISHFLNIDENEATSIFRREYPSELMLKPELKKDREIGRRFIWGPRLTFLAAVLFIIFVVVVYLGFQYRKFNSPPGLVISTPVEGQTVNSSPLEVQGKTDADATLSINNQPIVVKDDGSFEAFIDVADGSNKILVSAKSRSGKESKLSRTIVFKP